MLAPKIRANRIVMREYMDNFTGGKPPFNGTSYNTNALNNLSVNLEKLKSLRELDKVEIIV